MCVFLFVFLLVERASALCVGVHVYVCMFTRGVRACLCVREAVCVSVWVCVSECVSDRVSVCVYLSACDYRASPTLSPHRESRDWPDLHPVSPTSCGAWAGQGDRGSGACVSVCPRIGE